MLACGSDQLKSAGPVRVRWCLLWLSAGTVVASASWNANPDSTISLARDGEVLAALDVAEREPATHRHCVAVVEDWIRTVFVDVICAV